MRSTPTNERVLDEQTGGFNIQWQNYLAALETAKVNEDFVSLPTIDGTSTLDELRTYLLALDEILRP